MKIYNENIGIFQLPAKIEGFGVNEQKFTANRAKYADKGYFEFVCPDCSIAEKYELTPKIKEVDNIATFDYSTAEQYLIDNDNWHTPAKLTAKMGDLEGHNACLFYWFRMKFPETTGDTNPVLKAFYDRAVLLNLAPYLAIKNGGSEYYLYLSYIFVSDKFTVDENGLVIAPELLASIPIEQLAPAKIEGDRIILE